MIYPGFWLRQLSGWMMLPLLPCVHRMRSTLEGPCKACLGFVDFEDRESGGDLLRSSIPQNRSGLEMQLLILYLPLKEYKLIIFLLIVVSANGRQKRHYMCQGY